MSNIITYEQLNDYKAASTRTIRLLDGSTKAVRMTPEHWEILEALKILEGFNETDIAKFAEEEMILQEIDFDDAYRCCVAHLANRWTI